MKSIHVLAAPLWAAVLLVLTLAAPPVCASAGPPEQMTYQGFVVDANGQALGLNAPKNYDVIFRIYDAQNGGVQMWAEQQTVTVDKGYFSVLLGEGSPAGSEARPALSTLFRATDNVSDRFVELTVKGIGAENADVTIKPRLRLLTSPYAFLAQNAVALVSGTNQVVSTVAGYVGINPASPASQLDVTGTIQATGMNVNGPVNLNGVMTNTGPAVMGTVTANSLTVTGAIQAAALKVNGPTTNTGPIVTTSAFVGNGTIPVGGIIMWSGTTVPAGWALCDGNTYSGQLTPNLRGRFVLGSGSVAGLTPRTTGQTGGEETHPLTQAEMPQHSHTTTFAHNGYPDGSGDRTDNYYIMDSIRGKTKDFTTATSGSGAAHNTMPPFYVLAYIMRVQ